MSDSRFVTDPARLRKLLAERFEPWPLYQHPEPRSKWQDVEDAKQCPKPKSKA